MPRASAAGGERRLSHGERKRREILAAAIETSSAHGLGGLTIGSLAEETGMSKSGLFAHFGSKEELQLATVEAAAGAFERRVLPPTLGSEPGLARLRALLESWIRALEAGGEGSAAFFFTASAEFRRRRGAVRDLLAERMVDWLGTIASEVRVAMRQFELSRAVDPAQLAFELHAFVVEAHWARDLLRDESAYQKARAAIAEALRNAAEPSGGARRRSRQRG